MSYLKQSEAKKLIEQAFKNAGKKGQSFQMKHKGGQCIIVSKKGNVKGTVATGGNWFECVNCLVNGLKILKAHKAKKIAIDTSSGGTTKESCQKTSSEPTLPV